MFKLAANFEPKPLMVLAIILLLTDFSSQSFAAPAHDSSKKKAPKITQPKHIAGNNSGSGKTGLVFQVTKPPSLENDKFLEKVNEQGKNLEDSFELADGYFRFGQYEMAAAEYTKLIKSCNMPMFSAAGLYAKRADAYNKMGRYDLEKADRAKAKWCNSIR